MRGWRVSGLVGLAVVAGVAQGLSLAWPWAGQSVLPQGQPVAWMQWVAMCVWWVLVRQSPSRGAAAWYSWLFATAWMGTTCWWLYVSLHTYGAMPGALAAAAVALLAGALALFYVATGALVWRWRGAPAWVQGVVVAAAWLLAEWARGRWLTGFPWGAVGYAQVDAWGWLAPWIGVYGMSAFSAGLAAWAVARLWPAQRAGHGPSRNGRWLGAAPWLLLPFMVWPSGGHLLLQHGPSWTESTGRMPVALLQGNIDQSNKFDAQTGVPQALSWYGEAVEHSVAAFQSIDAPSLIVAPETAIPLLPQEVDPQWWAALEETLAQGRSALMLGLPLGSWQDGYTNSVMAWSPSLHSYRYDKHHLVPFGEFIPVGFAWFVQWLNMPLGSFAAGPLGAPPLQWGGQRLAVNICYEDLFGEEIAVTFADIEHAPTALVNVSNIAWFGHTVAIDQHRHISRMRALEFERPMLRATNTGATAVIDHHGRVVAEAPPWQATVLYAEFEGRQGLTPYARWVSAWGLWPLVALAVGLLLLLWRRTR